MKIEVCVPSKWRPTQLQNMIRGLIGILDSNTSTGFAFGVDTDDVKTFDAILSLRDEYPLVPMRVELNHPGDGHVVAFNRLLKSTVADIVVPFPDDARMSRHGWNTHLAEHFEDEDVHCVGLTCVKDIVEMVQTTITKDAMDNSVRYTFTYEGISYVVPYYVCFALRRSLFDEIGYFDVGFRRWFGDLDYMLSLMRAKHRLHVCHGVGCYSMNNRTSDATTQFAELSSSIDVSHTAFGRKWFTVPTINMLREALDSDWCVFLDEELS